MTDRLIVVGGDAAGMSAASQARRRRPPDDLEIVAYERSSWVSYSACGEPYHIAGEVDPLEALVARTPEQFEERGIDVRIRHEVMALDTASRTVTIRRLDDDYLFDDHYDHVLIATGAKAVRPPITGRDLPGVHELRTLDDAADLRAIADRGPDSVVIVGGGYIGLETAEAFEARGWNVTVISAHPGVLDNMLDRDLSLDVVAAMRERGIDVITDTRVNCIVGTDRVRAVEIASGELPAVAVVLGLGSTPEIELARAAGIPIGPTGAIVVDDTQRTPVDGVWAAGDCAEVRHRLTGRPTNVHLGTVANKTGRVAGINLGGDAATFPGTLGAAITRVCELEVASVGLSESDAVAAGFDAVAGTARGTTIAGYMPQTRPMTIRAVAERGTQRLLGAQIVGGPGAGKRIDVFATAIWNDMRADDLEWTDLSYAPPFSGTWDLVAIAAREASRASR
ncbi:MAG TPA: FAD-dependent oxidoreductase [Acidimicrobiia bacterium]|nr:FAD-dependent oxidoreductase [Acidimicrobiia bacterium]